MRPDLEALNEAQLLAEYLDAGIPPETAEGLACAVHRPEDLADVHRVAA